MNTLSSQSYKGARDYYPEDKRIQNYIFLTWKNVVESYGYEEYGAPILEPLEVYAVKSGQELVNEQTYTFVDRGGRQVAIRPEMTPSVCRMVASRRQELAYPARLYSIANFMRYERPQRGREREFWQLNVDVFGYDGAEAEAEVISIADQIMKKFGAKADDYVIKINNRKLINYMMAQYLGLDVAQSQQMIKLLDRKDKISREDFVNQAKEIFGDWAEIGLVKIDAMLGAKSMADLPAEICEHSSVREIQELFTLLERADVDNVKFDITLMRGLDYYTGMVFEVHDTHPDNNRSMFGGGRYDGLVSVFGVEPISAVGFAPGVTTMENFLTSHDLLPKFVSTTDVYIASVGDTNVKSAKIANELRENGINVELDLSDRKLDKQLKSAIKKQIPYMMFIGTEEVQTGLYSFKDIFNSQDSKQDIANIIEIVTKYKRGK